MRNRLVDPEVSGNARKRERIMSDAASKPVALVTGAAQGIGEANRPRCWAVAGSHRCPRRRGRRPRASDGLGPAGSRGIEATGIRLDVTKAADWAEACKLVENRWGGLDALVNNAGVSSRGTIDTTDEALWDLTLGRKPEGPMAGHQGRSAALAKMQGNDHQHRLDAGDASHAGSLSLRRSARRVSGA